MSDRLKLSDPKGDAEVERVASALEQREDNSRIRQLEQNIAALERELARKKGDAGGSAAQGGNNKIGARKHASFKAISTAPSINKTPIGPTMVPIPYPLTPSGSGRSRKIASPCSTRPSRRNQWPD